MLGFLAETMIPSLQQSSLLFGQWHFTAGLQSGSLHGSGHTGWHGFGQTGWQTGLQGCSHGASQHLLSEHPTIDRADAHKKSNVAKTPSCFLIKDSFR